MIGGPRKEDEEEGIMKRTILIAAVFCLGLRANPVLADVFYMDLNLTPDQQGFDLVPIEGTVQTITSPTCFTFHAEPGRNAVQYENYPGGTAGQPFEISLTTELSGRGGLSYGVGNYWMSIAHDPIYNDFWVGIYDTENSVYKGISGYIDTSLIHEYRAEVDAGGNYSVFLDDSEVLTGTGWTNGDLSMQFSGDFTFYTYTADAKIYECIYIPEPCSILLLSLGALTLRKRK